MAETPAKPVPRKNSFKITLEELQASAKRDDGTVERGLSEQAALMLLAYVLACPDALKVHDGKGQDGKDKTRELTIPEFASNMKRCMPPAWVALRRASSMHFSRAARLYGMPVIEPLKLQAEMAELAKSTNAPTAAA